MTAFAAWQNFYVIVGSSAGALIGLQFVVLSLISARPEIRTTAEGGRAFSTPNIVHFAAVLGLSGILTAPWDQIGAATLLWGLVGLAGVAYSIVVARRMRAQTVYRPEFEDWLFHAALPLAAYLTLAASAFVEEFYRREALYGVGAAALVLLFASIHNAWDAVTYHVFVRAGDQNRQG